MLTTVAVETVVLLASDSLSGADFGAIGVVFFTGLLVMVGIAINVIAGCLAHKDLSYGWSDRRVWDSPMDRDHCHRV